MVLHAKPKAALEENVHGSAKMADSSDLGPEYESAGIPLGPDLYFSGERHLFTIALSRTGKGRDVQIPTLLEYPASTIVVDPKGQLAAVTARRRREMGHEVFVINPFKSALSFIPSHGFNPLAVLNPDDDNFVEDVRSLSESIVVDTGDGKNSHFVSSARALLAGFIMHVVLNKEEKILGMVTPIHHQKK